MIFLHMQTFKLGFSFGYRVVSAKVGVELSGGQVVVRKPHRFIMFKGPGSKQSSAGPLRNERM